MKIIHINIKKITPESVNIAVDYFLKGGIIAYPSDTVYGLGGIATDRKIIDKIFKIKDRNRKKPLVVLMSGLEMVKKYCYISQKQANYLKNVWPGPITIILKSRGIIPKEVSGGMDSIAVRVPKPQLLGYSLPKNDFLTTIIGRVNTPLISTSLNISGSADECIITGKAEDFFKPGLIDLSVNIGLAKHGRPSRVIDIRDINNIKILRK